MTLLKRLAVAVVLLMLLSCQDRDPLGPLDETSKAILDSKRAGNPYFYWLAPIGTTKNSGFTGSFDGGRSPRIVICELTATGCAPDVATPPVSVVSAKGKGQPYYSAKWDTKVSFEALDVNKTYRIQVWVEGATKPLQLGFADLDLVSTRSELKSVPPDFVGVVNGSTLDINFRIEQGALEAAVASIEVSPTSLSLGLAATAALTATLKNEADQPVTGARRVDWRSLNPATATVDQSGVVTGVAVGETQIVAESEGQTQTIPVTVTEGVATEPAVIRCTAVVSSTPGLFCASTGVGTSITDGSKLMVGGQGTYVQVTGSNAAYDAATSTFSASANIKNLIWQALGTTDGVALDPGGVKVFLVGSPIVTDGSGTVSMANADGTATFTADDQPYFQYNQMLSQGQTTSMKSWQFSVPGTVSSFTFDMLVAANVQFPDGRIEVIPSAASIQTKASQTLAGNLLNAVGDLVTGPSIAWSSADTTTATVVDTSGVVTGVRAGLVSIVAVSGTRTGTATVTVTGITRLWTGAVNTDWQTRGNWGDNIVPVAQDSVIIPASPSGGPNYPVLSANASINGVTVEDGATLSVGPFNLTASGNVLTGFSGGINGTAGRLILSGVARTVAGIVPRLLVTGTYSLSGNLTTQTSLRAQSGRLRNTSFRIRANP